VRDKLEAIVESLRGAEPLFYITNPPPFIREGD
jgi:hypothetical protein